MKYLLISFFFFLTGCMATAKGPLFSEIYTVENNDKSEIIIFRNRQFLNGGACIEIDIDGESLGFLATNAYIRKVVNPGEHILISPDPFHEPITTKITTKKSSTYYIEHVTYESGYVGAPVSGGIFIMPRQATKFLEAEPAYALASLKIMRDSSVGVSCSFKWEHE